MSAQLGSRRVAENGFGQQREQHAPEGNVVNYLSNDLPQEILLREADDQSRSKLLLRPTAASCTGCLKKYSSGGMGTNGGTTGQYPLSTSSTAASSPVGGVLASNVTCSSSSSSPPPPPRQWMQSRSSSLLSSPSVPVGVFREDSPPSPGLTKNLLALAQQRKKGGQHSLGSDKRLHLSNPPSCSIHPVGGSSSSFAPSSRIRSSSVDRVGIPDDLFRALVSAASIAKKSGRHILQRRRSGGLAGEQVHTVLVSTGSTDAAGSDRRRSLLTARCSAQNMDMMPVLSPSLF